MKKVIVTGTFVLIGAVLFTVYSFSSAEKRNNLEASLIPVCEQVTIVCPGTGGPAYYCNLQSNTSAPDCQLNPQGECDPIIVCR